MPPTGQPCSMKESVVHEAGAQLPDRVQPPTDLPSGKTINHHKYRDITLEKTLSALQLWKLCHWLLPLGWGQQVRDHILASCLQAQSLEPHW